MGNKLKYLLICILTMLVMPACTPNDSIKIGDKVPNISWTTITGEKIDLQKFRGSWVLLCYWCSCRVHRSDILDIRSVYDALYVKNLKVIVVEDVEWPEIALEQFSKENKIPFYLVTDRQNSVDEIKYSNVTSSRLQIPSSGRPVYFLIDPIGNLHGVKLGAFNNVGNSISNVIEFITDVIKVKFDNITVTYITSHEATIRWQTDKAVPSWIEIVPQNEQPRLGYCTVPTKQGTNHETILDCVPNTSYIFNIAASGLGYSLKMDASNRSKEYSFTTLPDNRNN